MIYGYARVSTRGQARDGNSLESQAIARAKGIRVDGRPKKEIPAEVFQKFFRKQKGGGMTVNECCSALKISRSTWYNLSGGLCEA